MKTTKGITNKELTALTNVAAAFDITMNQLSNIAFRGARATELFYEVGIVARRSNTEYETLLVSYNGEAERAIGTKSKDILGYLVSLGNTQLSGAAFNLFEEKANERR